MTRKKFFAMLTAAPLALTGALWAKPKPETIWEQQQRLGFQFHGDHQRCPHCHEAISLKDAAMIMHGDNSAKYVRIELDNGKTALVEVGHLNPSTMKLVTF